MSAKQVNYCLSLLMLFSIHVFAITMQTFQNTLITAGAYAPCGLAALNFAGTNERFEKRLRNSKFLWTRLFLIAFATTSLTLISLGTALGAYHRYALAEKLYFIGNAMTFRLFPEVTVASTFLPEPKDLSTVCNTLTSIYGKDSIQYRQFLDNYRWQNNYKSRI